MEKWDQLVTLLEKVMMRQGTSELLKHLFLDLILVTEMCSTCKST